MDRRTFKWFADRLRRRWDRFRSGGHVDTAGSINPDPDLAGRFCANPFTQFDVYEDGKAYCCCNTWLPTPLGSLRHDSIEEIWNSPAAQSIRESILDGSFRHCNHKVCPHIQAGTLPTVAEVKHDPHWRDVIEHRRVRLAEQPVFINLCNDASCNLYCPSCRTGRILYTKGREYQKRQHLQDIITEELFSRPTDRHFRVNITGSGDPFASPVFRNFLFNLDGNDFPNLSIHLQTNGVLLTPTNWRKLSRIHCNIAVVLVSFDAATEATYNITRRGGNWSMLLANTRRLGEFRRRGELRYLRLDFVVQQANFREMAQFAALGRELGADHVSFSMVLDWGTWTREEYREKCIWKQDHPEFGDFIEVLQDPIFDDPIVSLGNLSEYRSLALRHLSQAAS